jgi:hypothetical protein
MSTSSATTIWQPEWTSAPPTICSYLEWQSFASTGYWGMCTGAKDPACYPWGSVSTFSPVTACPSGWASFSAQPLRSASFPDDEILICCPDGYTSTLVTSYARCMPSAAGTFTVRASCGEKPGLLSTVLGDDDLEHVDTYHLELRYPKEDMGEPKSVDATTTSGAAFPTTESSSTGNSKLQKKGFSLAAKAGVGVAVPLVLFAVVLALRLFYRRRKRLRECPTASQHTQGHSNEGYSKAELPGAEFHAGSGQNQGGPVQRFGGKAELPGTDSNLFYGPQPSIHSAQWHAQASPYSIPAELGNTMTHDHSLRSPGRARDNQIEGRTEMASYNPADDSTPVPHELPSDEVVVAPMDGRIPVALMDAGTGTNRSSIP